MREIYLDNSATTRSFPEVAQEVARMMTEIFGNPSSPHRKGLEAQRILRQVRQDIASFLGVKPHEIYFTSGGTESNNTALKGAARARRNRGRHIITSKIEHPSILDVCADLEDQGFEVTYLDVTKDGTVLPENLQQELRPETIMVSIMHVNNEIGTVEPIRELAKTVKEFNSDIIFHVDAVQSLGKIPVHPKQWEIDMLSASGHKLHGPKGVGLLYIRERLAIKPLLNGGGQESGIRSGTENVPGIVGFGMALEILNERMGETQDRMYELKEKLIQKIKQEIAGALIIGPENSSGAPHIVNVSVPGIPAEVIVHHLEEKGIYVSSGSACSSHKKGPSHVLTSLGLPDGVTAGSIRISMSLMTESEEIDLFIKGFKEVTAELRELYRL